MAKDWDEIKNEYTVHVKNNLSGLIKFCEKNFTPIESIAMTVLFELQQWFGINHLKVNPQKKIGKYKVDFLLVYHPIHEPKPLIRIVIECDGHEFHEKTKEQVAKDKERERFLVKEGYTVLRYSGSELVHDRFKLWSDIEELLIPDHLRESYGYSAREG